MEVRDLTKNSPYLTLSDEFWGVQFEYHGKIKYVDGLVQDYNNSIAYTPELLQCCTKPLM